MSEAREKPRGMTADHFQAMVLRLANAYWCRCWLRWPVEVGGFAMAIECVDYDGNSCRVDSLEELGYIPDPEVGERSIYVIPRLNEDGTTYRIPRP
jgi:hypothetical protein